MDDQTRTQVAGALLAAYDSKEPLEPLTSTHEAMTLEDAYAIQMLQIDQRLAQGRTVQGHKVGLTSAAMQRLLGVTDPDYGHLLDDFFHLEHMPIPIDLFVQPRIEPEVAFVLKKPLKGPGVTVHEALRAVDFVLPALEIVDSRIRDWKIGLFDTIADNASSGAVVLGSTPTRCRRGRPAPGRRHLPPQRRGRRHRCRRRRARLPAELPRLARQHRRRPRGHPREAGHVVLPGSVCAMSAVAAGDIFTATFAGLGSVTARFV